MFNERKLTAGVIVRSTLLLDPYSANPPSKKPHRGCRAVFLLDILTPIFIQRIVSKYF